MQRLRVLRVARAAATALLIAATLACGAGDEAAKAPGASPQAATPAAPAAPIATATAAPATAAAAASPAAAASAPAAANPPAPDKIKLGGTFDFKTPLDQVWPPGPAVDLTRRNGRPLAVFLWGTNSALSREDLLAFEDFVKQSKLRAKMDVYAVAGFSPDKGSAADVKEMAAIMALAEIPVLVDPSYELGTRLGTDMYPDLTVISSDNVLLAKGLRGADHSNLQVPVGPKAEVQPKTAAEFLQLVAEARTGPQLQRIWPFYPSDRLLRRKYPDFEAPMFSPAGWGVGERKRLSQVLSGKRPAVILFFSSTCDHCQVDIPQIVRFQKEHPGLFDIVGITRIRHATHRQVSDRYFKDQGITFPIFEDTGAISDLFKVTSTPTDFYLSPGGTIGSISYYQHADLAADWLKKHPILAGTPDSAPLARATGWNFPLKVKDAAGKEVDLASMKGKPMLLHFWATWCAPCRKELPDLVKRMPALQRNGNVLMVSVETDPALVTKYQKETGLQFASHVAPHEGLAKQLDFSRSVPRTYVLDGAGQVVQVLAGSYEWADEDKFTRILGRMTP